MARESLGIGLAKNASKDMGAVRPERELFAGLRCPAQGVLTRSHTLEIRAPAWDGKEGPTQITPATSTATVTTQTSSAAALPPRKTIAKLSSKLKYGHDSKLGPEAETERPTDYQ
jgi:hypothetical protein